jgi:hypothetical protein
VRSPEGDVRRWLGEGGSEAARGEVASRGASHDGGCGERCRLRSIASGCFQTQLEERRSYGQIWIEELERAERVLPRAPVLLLDDVLPQLARQDDASLTAWSDALWRLTTSVRQSLLWLDAGAFTRPLLRQLNGDRSVERAWRLWPQDTSHPLSMHLAPAGYAPGSLLLEEESQMLTGVRLGLWLDRSPDATVVWQLPGDEAFEVEDPAVCRRGVTRRPSHETVVLPRACGPGELVPLAALVRLAAAASHARSELVCLDPRVGAAPGLLQGLAPHVKELMPGAKLARTGAEILDERWRRRRRWKHPLSAERLRAVAAARQLSAGENWEDVATVLSDVRRGERLVVGGLGREQRRVAAELVAWLAQECADAGPMGLRSVLWIGEDVPHAVHDAMVLRLPHDQASLEHALLAAERGPATWIVVSPGHLEDPVFRRWASRTGDALWVLPEAERGLLEHPLDDGGRARVLSRVVPLVGESGAAVLACVDSAEFSGWAETVAERLEGSIRSLPGAPGLADWRWRRVPLEDPPWTCPQCQEVATLAHRYDLCPRCGSLRVVDSRQTAAVRERVLEATARWLRQRGPHHPWMVLARDADEKRHLESLLGLGYGEDDLLGGQTHAAYVQNVVSPTDLWSVGRNDADVVLVGIPEDARWLETLVARLAALGFAPGVLQVLDHPLLWDEQREDLQTARLRWSTTRAEVEFRVRETLEGLVPRLRSRTRPAMIGLGPVRDPGEDPKLAWLLQALQGWRLEVPAGEQGGGLDWSAADAVAQATACLESFVRAHIEFGTAGFESVDWEQWSDEPGRRAARSFAQWALREGLLEREELARRRHATTAAQDFWRAARATAAHEDVELPAAPASEAPPAKSATPPVEVASHGWILGVAGSGKTRRASEVVRALAAGCDSRILVLVPHATSLLRWQGLVRDRRIARRVDVATVSELGLAFLRHRPHPQESSARMRLMPETQDEERDQLRTALLEDVSRRYAQATGHVPPVDWVYLERLLSGAAPTAHAAVAGAAGLDAPLLAECARAARYQAGWINDADLRQLSREWLAEHPYVSGAWRDRYRAVVLEDVETLHPDQLTFVEQMFPQGVRWTTGDPFLVAMPLEAREQAEYRSWRLSKEMARAASELLFVTHGEPATRVRSRDRHKGKVIRHHVLNLESCAAFLQSQLGSGRWDGTRVGVVVGHEGDLHRLGARLREAQVRVWPARDLGVACAPGPRQLLALLLVSRALGEAEDDALPPLLRVLLETEGHPTDELGALARAVVGMRLGSTHAPSSPQACYLQPLVSVARRVLETETLGQAFDALQRTHFLRGVLDADAAGGRLLDYVEARTSQRWRELLLRVDPAAIADPLAPGDSVWLAKVDQLTGLDFDHLVYLCTGHEPPELHYRVLGRARESLVVLYSERDPLASPR